MSSQLNILSQKEIYQIYGLPKLKQKQRSVYLEFTLPEQELVRKYKTPITRVYFLLQLAYFKFKQQFFIFNLHQVSKDVAYLQQAYFAGEILPTQGVISKPIRLRQQRVILGLTNYQITGVAMRLENNFLIELVNYGHYYINRGIVSHNNALVFPSFKRPENRLKPNQSDAKA